MLTFRVVQNGIKFRPKGAKFRLFRQKKSFQKYPPNLVKEFAKFRPRPSDNARTYTYTSARRIGSCVELEIELIQTHMAQKPMLRAEVGMRVRCANKASAE